MKEKFSYSKLSTYHTCKRAYYINYVLGQKNGDNIYSILGTSVHECVEGMLQKELTVEQAIEKFYQDLDFADFMGFTFVSDKTRENFIKSVYHYLENFKSDYEKVEIEKPFCLEFDDYCVQGYIDLIIHNNDGTVSIMDLKTSSMYSKKSIEEDHCFQLLIYALALEDKGYIVRDVSWDMMKYAEVKTKRSTKKVLRADLESDEEFKNCRVYYPFNDQTRERCLSWIDSTVNEIRSRDIFDDWECINNPFYCQNICKQGSCERYKELITDYAKKFN